MATDEERYLFAVTDPTKRIPKTMTRTKPAPQTMSNTNIARTRADMLLMLGSYAAAEALAHSSLAHSRRAAQNADQELANHWHNVAVIFEEAKRKLGELT